jgi:hypothetical protein
MVIYYNFITTIASSYRPSRGDLILCSSTYNIFAFYSRLLQMKICLLIKCRISRLYRMMCFRYHERSKKTTEQLKTKEHKNDTMCWWWSARASGRRVECSINA